MRASTSEGEAAHDLAYYQAVPYLLVIESVEREGEWLRRAEYPELPGCVAEAQSALEALEKLEQERLRVLREMWDRGTSIPVPRSPLLGLRPSRSHPGASPNSGRSDAFMS
jgi:predicted RNase H-like HicB family nuclease